ncbi:hypothetical protein [Melissospora conviva]|uniref:hypothetical protein n=1 Tax=Melissospora conviva TaxID=3388432 RepID=UPI003C299473
MIVVQRVVVRWGAHSRGATQADLRRAIPEAYELPEIPVDEGCVVHEVTADEAVGYRVDSRTACGMTALERVSLHAGLTDDGLVVQRLPGWDVYPASRRVTRLFTLRAGEVGRYRANFRFLGTTCPCAPYWYYEAWTLHIAYAVPDPVVFPGATADHDVDHRVHLYGGRSRRSRKQSA